MIRGCLAIISIGIISLVPGLVAEREVAGWPAVAEVKAALEGSCAGSESVKEVGARGMADLHLSGPEEVAPGEVVALTVEIEEQTGNLQVFLPPGSVAEPLLCSSCFECEGGRAPGRGGEICRCELPAALGTSLSLGFTLGNSKSLCGGQVHATALWDSADTKGATWSMRIRDR